MRLQSIKIIQAKLVCLTGLHIGAGSEEMHIGGVDNPVIKNPADGNPYIPGSSIKGKMRSLMEWRSGQVQEKPLCWQDWKNSEDKKVFTILQLFGAGGSSNLSSSEAELLGPARLAFWDCTLNKKWLKDKAIKLNLPIFEVKYENVINRITGVAQHPRQTERVVPGASFDFTLSVKCFDNDGERFVEEALKGMKLLELDGLGGSLSRGYGKVGFEAVRIDGVDISDRFDSINPFAD